MSDSEKNTVTRAYRHEPGDCARALAFLLTTSVRKKGGSTTALDSAKGGSSDSSAKTSIPKDA